MEVLIKTSTVGNDSSGYQDGDIVEAFSLARIRTTAAQRLFAPPKFGFNISGLRDDSALQAVTEALSQNRFERVSNDSVRKISLSNGDEEILPFPNLEEYLQRRLANSKHLIFGTSGSEIWFTKSRNSLDHEALWDVVENVSDYERTTFSRWQFTELEKVFFLPLNMTGKDFTDGGTIDVELSDPTVDEHRSPLVQVVGVDRDGEDEIVEVARRKYSVPYWDLTDSLMLDVDNVRATNRMSDGRIYDTVPHIDALCVAKEL
jgi:hypothetical protein